MKTTEMKIIKDQQFGGERPLFGINDTQCAIPLSMHRNSSGK